MTSSTVNDDPEQPSAALRARSAYIDALGLAAATFGPATVSAISHQAHQLGTGIIPGGGLGQAVIVSAISTAICGLWLVCLMATQKRRRALTIAAVVTAGAIVLIPDWGEVTRTVAVIGWAATASWLCLELARRRGGGAAQLGIATERAPRLRRQALRIGLLSFGTHFAAFVVSMILIIVAGRWLGKPLLDVEVGRTSVEFLTGAAAAGVEELVLVAGLITPLEAGRRSTRVVYAVAIMARVLPHLYYLPTALSAVVFAGGSVYLLRRFRRTIPLVVAHSAFNLMMIFAANTVFLAAFCLAGLVLGLIAFDPERSEA